MNVLVHIKDGSNIDISGLTAIKVAGCKLTKKPEYVGEDMLNFSPEANRNYAFVTDKKTYIIPSNQIVCAEFTLD